MKQPSLLVIFLTVFIDLIGFGIVLPLLPIYSKNFGANGFVIGAIMASYSAMQFLFSPVWGRLSDRIGRRPVLLVSTAGAALSYGVFAIGSGMQGQVALWVLLGSRMLAGICGANITVAQAYIADITPVEHRSKRMGLIGMAFGLGFIFGPAIGGFSLNHLGLTGPGWIAAGFCAANFILALIILPESWKPSSEHVPDRPRMTQWAHVLARPKIGLLVTVFFLATFCFTCFETTLPLLVSHLFNLDSTRPQDARFIAYLYAYCGIMGALVQGGAIGRLVRAFGEQKLIIVSLFMVAASLALLPFVRNRPELLAALALLAIGSGLTRPPVFGLLSMLTPAHEQGETIGVAQSAGSLARIVGPIFAASLFDFRPAFPYVTCGIIALAAGLIAWKLLHGVQPAAAAAPG